MEVTIRLRVPVEDMDGSVGGTAHRPERGSSASQDARLAETQQELKDTAEARAWRAGRDGRRCAFGVTYRSCTS